MEKHRCWYIRETNVIAGESEELLSTLALEVEVKDKKITFIDTPYEALLEAREQSNDIVILIVAADDGLMPQTIEVIIMQRLLLFQ